MFFAVIACIKLFADTFENTTYGTDLILATSIIVLLGIIIWSLWSIYKKYKIRSPSLEDSMKNVNKYLCLLEEHFETSCVHSCAKSNVLRTYECDRCAKLHEEIIPDDTKRHIKNILNHWDSYANGVYNKMQPNSLMYNSFGATDVGLFFYLLPYVIQSQNSSLAHYQGVIWLAFRWIQKVEVRELEQTLSLVNVQGTSKDVDFSRYQRMLKDAENIEENAQKAIHFHYNKPPIDKGSVGIELCQQPKEIYETYNTARENLIDSLVKFRKTYCISRTQQNKSKYNKKLDCVLERIDIATT